MQGYSSTSLIKKLGYKPDDVVCAIGEPLWYGSFLVEHGAKEEKSLPATWMHLFVSTKKELLEVLASLDFDSIEKGLCISWPRKVAKIETDILEHDLREAILPFGWVDVKVCTINEQWSGLKFLRRKMSVK